MQWNQIVEKIKPYVVKIETPRGNGTGFLCLYDEDKRWCGIATAMHVVEYADEWQQPIRIIHSQTFETIFLKESERVIFSDWKTDSVIIFFPKPQKAVGLFFILVKRKVRNNRNCFCIHGQQSYGNNIAWLINSSRCFSFT